MLKSYIRDIAALALSAVPFAICLAFNTHPASAGTFGCFVRETPPEPPPAWQIERDRKDASIRAQLFWDDSHNRSHAKGD